MREKLFRVRWLLLPVMVLAGGKPARADTNADRQEEVEMAFDHYTAAKTEDQRTAVIDFLQHFDRKLVADALIDHIVGSENGAEATAYNKLIEALSPDGCAALLDRLGKTEDAVEKGKIIVAFRHCQSADAIHALAGCLDDKRPVPFEAHGSHPRRVCDLAYDELYLKLRSDPQYGLDSSSHMKGVITEKTPVKSRDTLIGKLKVNLAAAAPAASATPGPSASPAASASATPANSGTATQ